MKAMNPYVFPGLRIFPWDVERAAAEAWNVPVNNLYQRTREREVVAARYSTFYYRKKEMNEQESDIAKTVPFDRTTIIHAIKAVEDLLEFNNSFREKYGLFRDALSNDLVSTYKAHR